MAKKVKLPALWYLDTVQRLIREELPAELGPLSRDTAWRYVYALVLWTESKDGQRYVHLNDRLSSEAGKQLAKRGEEYLQQHLSVSLIADIEPLIFQVGKAYEALRATQGVTGDWQRNNVTGAGLETAIQALINEICHILPTRSPELHELRGFELAPKGYHSRPDLILFTKRDFRVLVSTKWTLRKERLGTFLHEAYFYRQRRADLQVAFVVNEFNLNILEWLINDPLVDRVYHVNKRMLMDVHSPFSDKAPVDIDALIAEADAPEPKAERGQASTPAWKATLKAYRARRQEIKDYQRWANVREKLFDLTQLFDDVDKLNVEGSTGAAREEAAPLDEAVVAAEAEEE